jgi:hypothetical protein
MGNLPSMFCPSESHRQCIGRDSILLVHPSTVGVMLTPAEGRFLTNDVPHGSSTPNLDPSVALRTTVVPRPTHRGGRRKKKSNKCFVANRTSTPSPTFKPTNSLPKRHRFKQQDMRGPKHSGAKHSTLYAAKANRTKSQKQSDGPYLVRSGPTLVRSGPTPKRSQKWQTRLSEKKKQDDAHHQAPTDTIGDDYDLISESDLQIFTMKVAQRPPRQPPRQATLPPPRGVSRDRRSNSRPYPPQ